MIFRAIDKIILSIKLPSEIKRAINDRHHFKANEFRYISYYLTFALFKDNLKLEFFNNMLKYIIFLRLLSKDFVPKFIIQSHTMRNFKVSTIAVFNIKDQFSNRMGVF